MTDTPPIPMADPQPPEPCPTALIPYARALLGEEGSEIAQAVFKGCRFGFEHARRDGVTANALLNHECGDILAAIAFGMRAGVINPYAVSAQRHAKFTRLTDPTALDDEGRRLAPELPYAPRVPLIEALQCWPAMGDALSAVLIGNIMTEALETIQRLQDNLDQAAMQFRSYEQSYRKQGEDILATRSGQEASEAAQARFQKAERNKMFAQLCEDAANVR